MNTNQLALRIAEETGLNKKEVRFLIDTTFETITEALKEGERVQINGFGSFFTRLRPARVYSGRFNAEGKETPEKIVAKFKVAKQLADSVSG